MQSLFLVRSSACLISCLLLLVAGLSAREIAVDSAKPAALSTAGGGELRLSPGARAEIGRRGVFLIRGTALVSARKRLARRRSEALAAGPLEIGCRGTVLVAAGAGSTKVTCLEGSATVRMRERRGQFASLEPGMMMFLENGSPVLPDSVEVDLDRLVRTSRLLVAFGPLASQGSIDKQIAKQGREMERGTLIASNLTVTGSGGTATIGADAGSGSSNGSTAAGGSGTSSGAGSGGGSTGGGSSAAASGTASVASTATSIAAASGCG